MLFSRLLSRRKRIKAQSKGFVTDLKTLKDNIHLGSREFLERESFKFAVAYNITREISGNFDLETTLNMLVDRIAEAMSVEIVSLMLVGKNSGEMLIKFAKGLDKEVVKNVKVKLGEGISGWVAQTGESLLIKDIRNDSRFSQRPGKYSTNSLLTVPLKIQDKVIGVININNKTSREIFNEEDLDTLNRIADLAALAVINSRFKEDAKELDGLRTNFIANVSHELRTPLAALKESVAIILEEIAGRINEQQRKFLSLATKNIARLGRLIDDLLDFSKSEAKQKEMRRILFDMSETVESVAETLTPLAAQKNIQIKSYLPGKKIEIWGDEDRLHDVITNFIGNAIKYNKPNGKVEVRLEDSGRNTKIAISDTGIGIAEQDFDKIFDRFRRIERSVKGKIKGTGLGLSIAKDIVEIHGGDISVVSKINKGTTFTITLPKNLRIRR